MRRLTFLAIFALLASLTLAPAALAQEEQIPEIFEEQVEDPQEPQAENAAEGQQEAAFEEQVEAQQGSELSPQQEAALEPQAEVEGVEPEAAAAQPQMMEQTMMMESTGPLPGSGGLGLGNPSVLLPAAALLLGLGVLGVSVLRRR